MRADARTCTLIVLWLLIIFLISFGAVYSIIKVKGLSTVVNAELL